MTPDLLFEVTSMIPWSPASNELSDDLQKNLAHKNRHFEKRTPYLLSEMESKDSNKSSGYKNQRFFSLEIEAAIFWGKKTNWDVDRYVQNIIVK